MYQKWMVCGRKYANHSPNKDSIIESQSFNLDYGVYAVSMRYELLQRTSVLSNQYFCCLKINKKWKKNASLLKKISYFHNDTTLGHLPNAMV